MFFDEPFWDFLTTTTIFILLTYLWPKNKLSIIHSKTLVCISVILALSLLYNLKLRIDIFDLKQACDPKRMKVVVLQICHFRMAENLLVSDRGIGLYTYNILKFLLAN